MTYNIILFLHIIGALLLSAAIAIEWLCVAELRKADSFSSIQKSINRYSGLNKIGGIAMLLILVPGIYLMITVWKDAGWIIAGFLGLILIGAIGGILTGRKIIHMKKLLINEEKNSNEIMLLSVYKSIYISIYLRTSIFLGIVFMMTVKPGLSISFLILVVSACVGLLPLSFKKRFELRQ